MTQPDSAVYRFDAIGAPWRIDTAEPLSANIVQAINARIDEFDRTYSRFRPDSLVTRINTTPGVWTLPADAPALLNLYRWLYERTDGAVSPLVGERMENLGYDSAYSLTPRTTSVRVPSWDDAISWDGETLTTVRPVLLDVGAAGKGYLVDIVAGILLDHGIGSFVVDASGDLLHRGDAPLSVALEDPRDATRAIGVYELQNAALCASASNRRAWGNGLHHIIDGITGVPTASVIAAWAIAPTTLVADGLATGLFFRGAAVFAADAPAEAVADPSTSSISTSTATTDFQYVRMFATGSVEYSRNLNGEMFT
ncbi:FAD:protein FMN transferase [Glaciihabitans sp. dw_435]|uniref:FAD:protein FMN transferase n=1 Tax=Glaciihabitans sp. dw_435 TaxID=2720081 RepID=UPI001BD55EE7|nr:FAD:protein FMN transferase [Glaciihabitans sp. dw_435]